MFSQTSSVSFRIGLWGFLLGQRVLACLLICLVSGSAALAQVKAQDERPSCLGTCPAIANSQGSLSLLVKERKFSWSSSDSILGAVDTGDMVTATTWNYFPGSGTNRARVLCVGRGVSAQGDVAISANVLLDPYNRAVVDVVQGGKRVRYLLTKLEVVWVNDSLEEADAIPTPSEEDKEAAEPFDHDPGEPGGVGGFGGPPAGSGFKSLADPFTIENLRVSDDGSAAPATMTLTLRSNVSAFVQAYTLTETTASSDVFVDADDSLAVQAIEYSRHRAGIVDSLQLSVASMAFGARRSMIVYETGGSTEAFASEHLALAVDMTQLPDPGVADVLTATLSSNLKPQVAADTLTETGNNTRVFVNPAGTFRITLERLTANGAAGKDDFRAFVDSDVLGVRNTEIDAIENGAATLQFRTAALANAGGPGTGPGALKGLAVGDKWFPALKAPRGLWPFKDSAGNKAPEKVIIGRERGADTTELESQFIVQWDPEKSESRGGNGDFVYYGLYRENGERVFFLAVEEEVAGGPVFELDGDNFTVRAMAGDELAAEADEHPEQGDKAPFLTVTFDTQLVKAGYTLATGSTAPRPVKEIKATIKPGTASEKVKFDSSNEPRATITEVSRVDDGDSKIVTIKVFGVSESAVPFDPEDAKVRARSVDKDVATVSIKVIVPKTQDHSVPPVTFANYVTRVAGGVRLGTNAYADVKITIKDQYGDVLDSVYDGDGVVTEEFTDKHGTDFTTSGVGAIVGPDNHFRSGIKLDRSGFGPGDILHPQVFPASREPLWLSYTFPLPGGFDNMFAFQLTGTVSGDAKQAIKVHGHRVTPDYRRTNEAIKANYLPARTSLWKVTDTAIP